jgi:Flp pilus assembly protein TadG
VAHAQALVVRRRERGQVLAFFAIVLPIILLPLAAYAVDVAFVSTRGAGLQEATAQAAEAAAQQADIGALRSRSELAIDASKARAIATQSVRAAEPGASVEAVQVAGAVVTVTATEVVMLPFNFLPPRAVKLEAHASARLVGYDSPSSRLPLPTSTF